MNPDVDLLESISYDSIDALRPLKFGPPVSYIYNPLDYARESLGITVPESIRKLASEVIE